MTSALDEELEPTAEARVSMTALTVPFSGSVVQFFGDSN